MDHAAHIRTVDSHAERIGGNQNRAGFVHETVLRIRSFRVGHSRVIGDAFEFILKLFDGFSRRRVDDGRHPFLRQQLANESVLLFRTPGMHNGKSKVRTLEAGDMQSHLRAPELFDDILPHMLSRSRRESADLRDVECLDHFPQAQIRRAEVMPPLADAVRFIHDKRTGRIRPQKIPEGIRLKTLRSDIQKFHLSIRGIPQSRKLFRRRNTRIDKRRRNPPFTQGIHLILHQGNQRRNHDAVSGPHQERQLVTERFSRAGRHDDADILAVQDVLDDGLLMVKEGIKPEISFQYAVKFIIHTA